MADNQTSPQRLILASASPRRRQLLNEAGVSFQIVDSGVAENVIPGENAVDYALRVARDKALAVSARTRTNLVLAADTVVECAGGILGKPADEAGARAMLNLLSGRTHVVITAFALARAGRILESAWVASRVSFRALSAGEIEAYVASGEPLDKAGAYGIQGKGGEFIAAVEGSRDNVMGLPTREVLAMLERHGVRGRRAEQ